MELTLWDSPPTVLDHESPVEDERRNPSDVEDTSPNFDAEAVGRDDFHSERFAREFMEEEEPIRHDVLPESDDDEGMEWTNKNDDFTERSNGNLYKGQKFLNGVSFKEAVVDYALHTGYNIRQYRYNRCKIGFKCVGGVDKECEWVVYASSLPKDHMWRIRKYKTEHKCIPNGRCELIRVPVIARIFLDKLRDDPDYYMPQKMEEIMKEKWKISVSRPQCQAARRKALKWVEAEFDDQFRRMRDYAAEISLSNPDSIVEVATIPNEVGEDVFNRLYVCFNALRTTCKESCRPLIGVDGCFLKLNLKG